MSEGEPVHCGECGRHLVDLLLLPTRPLLDPCRRPAAEWVRCECPYCGGHSHPVEMRTTYFLSAAVRVTDPATPGEYRELTEVVDQRRTADVVTYVVREAKCQ